MAKNINSKQDNFGNTHLHLACAKSDEDNTRGKYQNVRWLLKHGADPNAENRDYHTPVHKACATGDLRALKLLTKYGANLEHYTSYSESPFQIACLCGHLHIVKYLTEQGVSCEDEFVNNDNRSHLHYAAFSDNSDLISFLLLFKFDVNQQDVCGFTPLHIVCAYGSIDSIRLFLSSDMNIFDREGYSPLHLAIKHNQPENVAFLLENGANIHLSNSKGVTPYNLAFELGHCLDVIRPYL